MKPACRMRRSLAGLLILCASTTVWADEVSHWQSDFGRVTLQVARNGSVTGHYPQYRGTLSGFLVNDEYYDMHWVQPTSDVRCRRAMNGSHYWGQVRWTILSGNRLSGVWSYCEQDLGSGGRWNATLE
ncbi:MAG: hypothetical protein H7837_04585 [Magnetococcus sp. MYC-9]